MSTYQMEKFYEKMRKRDPRDVSDPACAFAELKANDGNSRVPTGRPEYLALVEFAFEAGRLWACGEAQLKPTEAPTPELHVYEYADCEWVIANDPEDAFVVLGITERDGDFDPPKQLPDDKLFGIWCGEDGKPADHQLGTFRKLPCSEWIALLGRGYLGTTES